MRRHGAPATGLLREAWIALSVALALQVAGNLTGAISLGLETVAEGVELEPQVAALLALGCVAGQGFLFARATSLKQLSHSSFVARRNALWTTQAARETGSPTGRFEALESGGQRTAGAARVARGASVAIRARRR